MVVRSAARILGAVTAVVSVPVAYLGALTACAWVSTARRRARGADAPAPVRNHLVVIPAHDEEAVLAEALGSLRAMTYPRDRFEVVVVADHCSDRTVEIAAAAGCRVLTHDVEPRGKGPSLQWAFEQLLEAEPPDVVVVLDADTSVEPELLAAFDRSFEAGALVVQGHYGVRSLDASPSTALRSAALSLRHHLRPLGRRALGGTCGLFGNGMAFDARLLRGRRWTGHLVEDHEFQLELLREGVIVEYQPDARLAAEMPTSLEASVTQHERWEGGRLQLVRRHGPRLLRTSLLGRPGQRWPAADAALDLIVPPLSVLVALVSARKAVGAAARRVVTGRPDRVGTVLVSTMVVHVVSGLILDRAPRVVYTSLLRAPGLIAWKLRLYGRAIGGRSDVAWQRTTRNSP